MINSALSCNICDKEPCVCTHCPDCDTEYSADDEFKQFCACDYCQECGHEYRRCKCLPDYCYKGDFCDGCKYCCQGTDGDSCECDYCAEGIYSGDEDDEPSPVKTANVETTTIAKVPSIIVNTDDIKPTTNAITSISDAKVVNTKTGRPTYKVMSSPDDPGGN